nr:Protein-tyrosine phosphatase domain containing protein [Haemonchus contortus]
MCCTLSDSLCEEDEYCFLDGVFGQCYSPSSGAPKPTVIDHLDDTQLELLRLELTRLAKQGLEWPDQRAQCVLSYFKLSMYYGLQYDPDFCQVRNPANIWALIQLIEMGLNEDPTALESEADEVPVIAEDVDVADDSNRIPVEVSEGDEGTIDAVVPLEEQDVDPVDNDTEQIQEPAPQLDVGELTGQNESGDPEVEEYIERILREENPDLSQLSDDQLNELINRLFILKNNLADAEEIESEQSRGEAEEAIPLDALADEKLVLKKDAEELGDVRQGLENVEHKIVKGRNMAITRVVGNRVYLKVNIKDEEQLYPLIEFLQNKIATPNNLLFDDFQFDKNQLSMRISRLENPKPKNEKRIDTVEGVAQAVYKRRKDIARFSGAQVDETGIGIGEDSVPVESSDRDWMFMPVLFICAFTITALISVMAVHLMKHRRFYTTNITNGLHDIEGKNSLTYQELCRQRMNQDTGSGRGSKSSSTSSWCEEAVAQSSIDISTGHVILNFLQDCLADPSKIEAQWDTIRDYRNPDKHVTIGTQHANRNRSVVPFDESLVPVDSWEEGKTEYLNASFIYDDDPRQPVYIAAQTPRGEDVASFWQAIWQHGVCLIVNLSTLEESKQEKSYWPESGSEVHGPFEIHLVSEHIWSDDYLVRSFYLKNLRNGQTRTITQFHYLSWKRDETPSSPKSLIEFRRKVNKSYRGRASPVLVHSWDGAGRTGVFCAVDLLCGRLLKGVRQLDVVASVEHLRDQRDGLVRTADQFKLIYGCVAQEVNSLLKALPQ